MEAIFVGDIHQIYGQCNYVSQNDPVENQTYGLCTAEIHMKWRGQTKSISKKLLQYQSCNIQGLQTWANFEEWMFSTLHSTKLC